MSLIDVSLFNPVDYINKVVADTAAALQGKIKPSDEARIKAEIDAAMAKAGATTEQRQQAQQELNRALEPYREAQAGAFGSVENFFSGLKIGAFGILAVAVIAFIFIYAPRRSA
jgi:hypothetical protein